MLLIDIKGSAEAPRERFDGHPFTAKLVADITEVMHEAGV
jgi:hypothetical protein